MLTVVLLACAGAAQGGSLIEDFELLFSDLEPDVETQVQPSTAVQSIAVVQPDGAVQPGVAVQPERDQTCDELYRQIYELEPHTRTYRKTFFNNPVNSAIATAASIAPPVAILLVVPELARYREQRKIRVARAQIAMLRDAMAYKQCYVEAAYFQ